MRVRADRFVAPIGPKVDKSVTLSIRYQVFLDQVIPEFNKFFLKCLQIMINWESQNFNFKLSTGYIYVKWLERMYTCDVTEFNNH